MHPLPKRIALLLAIGSFVIGLFLLGYNLRLISEPAMTIVVNLWPVLLVAGGIILVVDSTRKRVTTDENAPAIREFALPIEPGSLELACRLQFSYGTLVVSPGDSRLVTEHVGSAPDPFISQQLLGQQNEISVSTGQPLFPSHFQLHNRWSLELPALIPLRLSLQLHESNLRMDLRKLDVESLELRAEAGTQEIYIGRPGHKMTVQVYSSGGSLSLFLPAHDFSWVRLLNPFCRVDYPQGDLEKREDGSLVTPRTQNSRESVEIEVDGPIRNLVLDIVEASET
jgi:hypothetical protein